MVETLVFQTAINEQNNGSVSVKYVENLKELVYKGFVICILSLIRLSNLF